MYEQEVPKLGTECFPKIVNNLFRILTLITHKHDVINGGLKYSMLDKNTST
jgi:hypothetical protein